MALLEPDVRLPRSWPEHVRAATLHALALGHFVATHVRGWCLDSRIARVRLAAERDLALSKLAVAQETARILASRIEHVPAPRRPHYPPSSRLAILTLRAGSGWTVAETARRFLVSEQTITNWMHRLDDDGEEGLVRMPEPVSRFPDFVRHIVQALGTTFPLLGKVRIAQLLARAGLRLSGATVARMKKGERAGPAEPPSVVGAGAGVIRPRRAVPSLRLCSSEFDPA